MFSVSDEKSLHGATPPVKQCSDSYEEIGLNNAFILKHAKRELNQDLIFNEKHISSNSNSKLGITRKVLYPEYTPSDNKLPTSS